MYSPEEDIPILTRRRYICLYSPAVHHERVDSSRTARGWGLALMVLESSHQIRVVEILEWFHPNRPDLIEDHGIAPHVAGCGVLLVEQSLRSCPLDWDLASLGLVVCVINQVSGHSKISNLTSE